MDAFEWKVRANTIKQSLHKATDLKSVHFWKKKKKSWVGIFRMGSIQMSFLNVPLALGTIIERKTRIFMEYPGF